LLISEFRDLLAVGDQAGLDPVDSDWLGVLGDLERPAFRINLMDLKVEARYLVRQFLPELASDRTKPLLMASWLPSERREL
jgi:hypothetical protein